MKYYHAIFLVILLSSCQNVYNFVQDQHTDGQLGSQQLYYSEDFDNLDSYVKIAEYIKQHVVYDYDDDPTEHKDPEDILATGKGACGDISILFINIAYYGMNIKMSFITGSQSRSVVNGGEIDHAQVYYNGVAIEPQSGKESNMIVGYIYSFDECMSIYD